MGRIAIFYTVIHIHNPKPLFLYTTLNPFFCIYTYMSIDVHTSIYKHVHNTPESSTRHTLRFRNVYKHIHTDIYVNLNKCTDKYVHNT